MPRALLYYAVLCSIGPVWAQSHLSGPVSGFTFDAPTGSIRAVIGSLGSASLGPAILAHLDFASVAPGQDYAIAFRGGKAVLVSGLGSGKLSTTVLSDSASTPEGVTWADDGSVAVSYSQTESWIQTFAGLPDSASSGSSLSISALGGALSAVAAGSDSQRVVVGMTGDHAGVYQVAAGQASLLLDMSRPIALAFSEDGGTLYALDGATSQVSEFNLATLAVQTWSLGVDDPIAIRPARDATTRKVLYVATRSSRLLLSYDGSTQQALASVSLSFDPTVIEPLGTNGFLLRQRTASTDPLWSFTNGSPPVVCFVPATANRDPRQEVRR